MRQYVKRPIVIEATQIKPSDFTDYHPNDNHVPGVIYCPKEMCVKINTLEGMMVGQPGDWIIRGVEGELYPCKNSIFQRTYEVYHDKLER